MQEFFSEAIVLTHEPYGELDKRYTLFTKHFGKVNAKAKSARKITSKLSGHLEPGNTAHVRLVEQGTLHVVDALKGGRTAISPANLRHLSELLPDGEPESALWNLLQGGQFNWNTALTVLGWNPAYAACSTCNKGKASTFYTKNQEFFCTPCASKLPKNELILIIDAL